MPSVYAVVVEKALGKAGVGCGVEWCEWCRFVKWSRAELTEQLDMSRGSIAIHCGYRLQCTHVRACQRETTSTLNVVLVPLSPTHADHKLDTVIKPNGRRMLEGLSGTHVQVVF